MTNLPTPSELEYFLELAQTQNMSRAAERLGVRQPTLSSALVKLEQKLGTRLLTRTKRGVFLTDSGHNFLNKSRELLQSWKNLTIQTEEQANQIQGHLRVGCHVSVALYTLPMVLPQMCADFPNLEFDLVHDFSRKITEAVISLKLDIGIVVNPVRHPDLIIKKICEDEMTLFSIARLPTANAKILIVDNNLNQTQALLLKLKRKGLHFNRFIYTASLEVARDIAAAGGGVAILPTRVAQLAIGGSLKKMRQMPVFKDEICLIYRSERRLSPSIQMFAERIKVILPE